MLRCNGGSCTVTLVSNQLEGNVTSNTAVEAVERARKVHRRNDNTGDCEHCSKGDYPDYSVPWPCQTVLALGYDEEDDYGLPSSAAACDGPCCGGA